jgi:chromosome partitioning protein
MTRRQIMGRNGRSTSGHVFTIAQRKGGAGKTTLAAHLAVAWANLGHDVVAVDIDPQGSLSRWAAVRAAQGRPDGLQVVTLNGWRVTGEVERLAREHDIVVIDSPPHDETEARIAVRAATLVVVPIQPSVMDLWATEATLKLAAAEKRAVRLVLNRVPARSKAAEAVAAAAGQMGVTVAASRIGNRTALAAALAAGRGIVETDPSGIAAREIAALAEELIAVDP